MMGDQRYHWILVIPSGSIHPVGRRTAHRGTPLFSHNSVDHALFDAFKFSLEPAGGSARVETVARRYKHWVGRMTKA
jgi:hypothetical protein